MFRRNLYDHSAPMRIRKAGPRLLTARTGPVEPKIPARRDYFATLNSYW